MIDFERLCWSLIAEQKARSSRSNPWHVPDPDEGHNFDNLRRVLVRAHRWIAFSVSRVRNGGNGFQWILLGRSSVSFAGCESASRFRIRINIPRWVRFTSPSIVISRSPCASALDSSIFGTSNAPLRLASNVSVGITTERYSKRPLVVTGPGAGADVTAAGVLNDIVAIASHSERTGSRRSKTQADAPES